MSEVLVLNRNYQAMRIIGWRRAFTMLCQGVAEVLHIEDSPTGSKTWQNFNLNDWAELSALRAEFEPDEHDFIRTVRLQLCVPRIIRVLGYDRLPRQDVKFNRQNVYARDNSRCQYCGKKFQTKDLSLDHVVPKMLGGKATWDNMVCCCIKCNIKKGGRTPAQAGMKLITLPVKPKRNPVINIRVRDPKFKSWQQFVDEAYWTVDLK